jgi:hypothetical protein
LLSRADDGIAFPVAKTKIPKTRCDVLSFFHNRSGITNKKRGRPYTPAQSVAAHGERRMAPAEKGLATALNQKAMPVALSI